MRYLIGVLLFAGTALASVSTPLPDAVKAAVRDVWYVAPRKDVDWFASRRVTIADLNGDGKPDYFVEVNHEVGGEGDSDLKPGAYRCDQVVVESTPTGYAHTAFVDCCKLKLMPGAGGKKGRAECLDVKKELIYDGSKWPTSDQLSTKADALAAHEKGIQLFRAGHFKEAEPLLCKDGQMLGMPEPVAMTSCISVTLKLGENPEPEDLAAALDSDPTYGPGWGLLGRLFQDHHDNRKAVEAYQKYLELTPKAPNRADVEARIAKLKSQAR